MAYRLTRDDIASVTDVELAFSTDRLLPMWEDIPEDFRNGNLYTRLAESIFSGSPLQDAEICFRPSFDDQKAPADLNRCVRAHIQSFSPKHQHKIAGVGFMIYRVCEIRLSS